MKKNKLEEMARMGGFELPEECQHNEYCTVKKILEFDKCYKEETKTCQTYKYYKKWGKQENYQKQ